MSAGAALQAALVQDLMALGVLDGVYDGPPPRAAYPYVALDAGTESDWGHKSGAGREIALALTLWDARADGLQELADLVEACVAGAGPLAGWQMVSTQLLRRRVVRDVAGPWAVAMDFRVRLLKI
ncbi:MAG: DUF3168 domain-containing protein [Sphingomicrobium sp.]